MSRAKGQINIFATDADLQDFVKTWRKRVARPVSRCMCDRGLTAGILNAKSQSKMEVRRQRSAVRSPRRPPTSPVPNSNLRNSTIWRLRRAIPKNRAFSANFSLLRFLRLLLFKFPVFTALENTPCLGVSVVRSPPFFAICAFAVKYVLVRFCGFGPFWLRIAALCLCALALKLHAISHTAD